MNRKGSVNVDPFDGLESVTRSGSLVTLVADQIAAMILDGELRAGDQLPPERELCRQFGVSRTVVREAVARLTARNLLIVRPGTGGGIVVATPSTAHVSDALRFLLRNETAADDHARVLEVRRLLEVEIAGLAAQRHTAEDIARLESILTHTRAVADDRELFARNDVAFHTALAEATQNKLFVILLDSIAGIMLEVRRLGYNTPGVIERAIHHHSAILEQVVRGNPERARNAMRAHLEEAEDTMRLALGLRAGATAEQDQPEST